MGECWGVGQRGEGGKGKWVGSRVFANRKEGGFSAPRSCNSMTALHLPPWAFS